MSLISSIATIATAGAGGAETFWASSMRITTTTVSGQSMQDKTSSACQFGAGGDIIVCISSNAEGNVETHHNAYIARLDPTDGSLIATSRYSQSTNNEQHRFRADSPVFYHPTMNKCIARVNKWWSGSSTLEEAVVVINTSNTVDTVLNIVMDNPAAGNGNYIVSYVNNEHSIKFYNPSTGAVSAGQKVPTDDMIAFSLWASSDSDSMVLAGRHNNQSQRLVKISQSSSGFGGATATRDSPTLGNNQPLSNDYSNKSKLFSPSGVYGYADRNSMFVYEVYSSLSLERTMQFGTRSSYNGQGISTQSGLISMVVAGGSLYVCVPVIFRKVGDPQNSCLYAIFQINPSTFQVTNSLAVMSDAGAEFVNSNSGSLESNAEETCIYLTYLHSKINNRGGESTKVLKLPLDLSAIPDQTLSFNSTHDNIRIWEFSNTSTGGAYPVFGELFETPGPNYAGPNATYSRSVSIDTPQTQTAVKFTGNSAVSRTLLTGTADITPT